MRHLALLVIVLASCERAPKQLFSDAEVTARKAQVLARLAENRTRRCERPVLRGTPTPGPAAPDAQFVVEPNGDAVACREAIDALAQTDSIAAQVATPSEEASTVASRCGGTYESAIQRAIAHTDACSPFQIGVRAATRLLPPLEVAQVVGLAATQRATTDPASAMWLLIETMRWSADMARGDVAITQHALHRVALEKLAVRALAIVDTHALSAEERRELSAAIGTLLATEPPFLDAMQGERDYVDLVEGLAPLEGRDYVPPGGWGWMHEPDEPPRPADPRDARVMFWWASERALGAVAPACTPPASLLACGAAIAVDPAVKPGAPGTRDAATGVVANEIRTRVFLPAVSKYGKALALLATVQIHLALEGLEAGVLRCPAPDVPPDVRSPPSIGGAFRFTVLDDQIAITPPVWLGDEPLPAWPCPAR